jgi:hypothetical protein
MASHRSLVAAAALGFLATGCSLDATGLPYPMPMGAADASAGDAERTSDAAEEPPLEVSAQRDATDNASDGALDASGDTSAAVDGSDSSSGGMGTFAIGASMPTQQWGDSPGTSTYNVACSADQVIIGFAGTVSSSGYWIDIAPVCGTPSFDSQTFAVAVAPGAQLPMEGPAPMGGTTAAGAQCATNEVVVGFTAQDTNNGHIHQITIDCAKLTITPVGPPSAVVWSGVTTTAVGGLPPVEGPEDTSPDVRCQSNPAAVAIQTNNAFDALGLVLFGIECSPLTPQ